MDRGLAVQKKVENHCSMQIRCFKKNILSDMNYVKNT